MKAIDKNEHKLYFLYPLADRILNITRLDKRIKQKRDVSDTLKALYITAKPELLQKLFWCRRISLVMIVILIFNMLSLFGQLGSNHSIVKDGRYLLRPDHGEGNRDVELNVTMEQKAVENNAGIKSRSESHKISINLAERSYSKKELKIIFKKSFTYLQTAVLGSNQSPEQIYSNLNFIDTVPTTGIKVKWEPEDYNLIQMDGTVKNENTSAKGLLTSVVVSLEYLKEQAQYRMSFKIMPRRYSKEELIYESLKSKINLFEKKSTSKNYLELPVTLGKYRLLWDDKSKEKGDPFLCLGIITVIAVWLLMDKELEKKMKYRSNQMLSDYPEIINKFTLLVNAGMTVKQAWSKISEDYTKNYANGQYKKRYAYEEMLITMNELKLGQSENIAYEQYGRRVGLIPYIKFGSLISQNLKKGNKGFTELLMREAIDSFEDRKEIAKRLGEEAATKLLIPMALMLIIVLLIIMIPAFWSFRL